MERCIIIFMASAIARGPSAARWTTLPVWSVNVHAASDRAEKEAGRNALDPPPNCRILKVGEGITAAMSVPYVGVNRRILDQQDLGLDTRPRSNAQGESA